MKNYEIKIFDSYSKELVTHWEEFENKPIIIFSRHLNGKNYGTKNNKNIDTK